MKTNKHCLTLCDIYHDYIKTKTAFDPDYPENDKSF